MASEINRTGRIALYELYFDTNRTKIKPESGPTLGQIADLLKREPDLKILAVGHTDNVGDFESNRDLSQRRSESVVNALGTRESTCSQTRVSPALKADPENR